jgi:hypothetical protein
MPLCRILPRPSGTVLARPACAARPQPSLARLGLGVRSVRGPGPGPARPDASAHDVVRAAARHACSTPATSPAHGRWCGEGYGRASPVHGRWHGRPHSIDSGARTAQRRSEGDGIMAYQAESVTAASGWGRRRHRQRRRRGMDDVAGTRGSAATGVEAARQRRWHARTIRFEHQRSAVRVARRSVVAAWSGGGLLS